MAKTIAQIKKGMTDQFMNDPVIREKYSLTEGDTFEASFSQVSIENILFGIVASAAYVLEVLFDTFKKDIDIKVEGAVPATIAWYHKICLEYQHGDDLLISDDTQDYYYEDDAPEKRVVKYAACRDMGAYVYILVSGEDTAGLPTALSNDVITAFEQYLTRRKPAGIQLDIKTYDPDDIMISARVEYDQLVMNDDGSLVSDTSIFPVEQAIGDYLKSIEYGGVFNKTKLIDAIQGAEGVKDVSLDNIMACPAGADKYADVPGNNYTSVGGALKAVDLRNTIEYVTQL